MSQYQSPQWGEQPSDPWSRQAPPQYQPQWQQPPNQHTQYRPQQQWPPQQGIPPQKQWQQQPYPPQYNPQMPLPQWPLQQPPKHRVSNALIIGLVVFIILLIAVNIMVFAASGGNNSPAASTDKTSQATQPAQQPTTVPTPTPTTVPTPTPSQAPTPSLAQLEQAFKASAISTTIATLDKDGNNDQGHIVHFTCTIFGFVKDSSGNTAGANVDDPNTSGVIQVAFPAGTDLSQLNTGDTLEVWGVDSGTSSGQNAFGATVQEVGVAAAYMTDQTTNYSTS